MLNQQDQINSLCFKSSKQLNLHVNESILTKISNHLQIKRISIEQFWLSERNFATPEQIIEFCQQRGLLLDENDSTILKGELFAKNQTINLDVFVKSIPYWNEQGTQILRDFHMKRSEMLLSTYQNKSKERARSKISRPRSHIEHRSMEKQASVTRFQKEAFTKTVLTKNNSSKYLKKHKQRELVRQKQLNQNIQKNKIDEQYVMLSKMSQLNLINKQKQNNIAFRAYKSAQGILKVKVFNLNKFQKQISLQQFDTIYKNYKKKTKQNKQWAITPQNTLKQYDQLQSLKNRNIQKSQRQKQLQNLLQNTINLTNLLKGQIKIFKMKGIYGCQNI